MLLCAKGAKALGLQIPVLHNHGKWLGEFVDIRQLLDQQVPELSMFNCQSGEPIPDCTALSKVMPASTVESQCHKCRHLPVPSFTFVSICMTSTVANNSARGNHRWLNRDQPEQSACEPCWQVSCSPFCTAVLNNIQCFAIQAFVLGCCCCRDSAAGSLLCLLASSTHGRSYVQAVLPVCKRVRGGSSSPFPQPPGCSASRPL